MATRFDASGDYFIRTASLPSTATVISFDCWIYIVNLNNTGFGSHIWTIANATPNYNSVYILNGVTQIRTQIGVSTGSTLSTNTWYHLAYTRNGATHKLYINGVLDITRSDNNSLTSQSQILIGGNTVNTFDGRMSNLRIFDNVELTIDQVALCMSSYVPKVTGGLHGWWPMLAGATERTIDFSGNARTLTANGTLVDEDNPPLNWGGQNPLIVLPESAAVSVTPGPATSATSAPDPGVILGSLVITPAVAGFTASAIAPTVVQSSQTVAPANAPITATAPDPTYVAGNIAVTPSPATSTTSATDPDVVFSSTSASPAPATMTSSAPDPTTVLGSLAPTLSPAVATTSAPDPSLVWGSTTAAPAPATATTSAPDPAVVQSSMFVSPATASTAATAQGPTGVIYGSLVVGPANAPFSASAPDPNVQAGNDVSVSPGPATSTASAIDPTVVQGSLTAAPANAPMTASAIDPTTVQGSVTATPATANATTSAIDPVVIQSSQLVAPSPAVSTMSAPDPNTIMGGLLLTPAPATETASGLDPTVVMGGLVFTPDPAISTTSAPDPNVDTGSNITITPAPASMTATALIGTVIGGLSNEVVYSDFEIVENGTVSLDIVGNGNATLTLIGNGTVSVVVRPRDPTMTQITVGDEQLLIFTYEDYSHAAINPDAISVIFKKPDGTLTTAKTKSDMENPETGEWRLPYTFDVDGRWKFRMTTTGNLKKAREGNIDVAVSEFA